MSMALVFLIPYFSRTRELSCYAIFVISLPRCLLWRFDSMSNIKIGLRRCGLKSLGSLWIRIYTPLGYLQVEYLMHHRKLNLC